MTNNVYVLKSDVENYSSFIQSFGNVDEESIMLVSRLARWKSLKPVYERINVELSKSNNGKKNYKFDISGALSPFFIISDTARNMLKEIIAPRGEFFYISTSSKVKKFWGYYPTNVARGVFDKKKSIYEECENGFIVRKPVLIKEKITDEYLFTVEEDMEHVFVTNEFREVVEKEGLFSFDFSEEVELST